jgi:hypothetical protein
MNQKKSNITHYNYLFNPISDSYPSSPVAPSGIATINERSVSQPIKSNNASRQSNRKFSRSKIIQKKKKKRKRIEPNNNNKKMYLAKMQTCLPDDLWVAEARETCCSRSDDDASDVADTKWCARRHRSSCRPTTRTADDSCACNERRCSRPWRRAHRTTCTACAGLVAPRRSLSAAASRCTRSPRAPAARIASAPTANVDHSRRATLDPAHIEDRRQYTSDRCQTMFCLQEAQIWHKLLQNCVYVIVKTNNIKNIKNKLTSHDQLQNHHCLANHTKHNIKSRQKVEELDSTKKLLDELPETKTKGDSTNRCNANLSRFGRHSLGKTSGGSS